MAWINIGNYLDKFKDFKPSRVLIKEEVAKTISDIINYDIEKDELEVRSGTVYLKIKNPGLRSQVFMKKNLILEALSARLGKRSPRNLIFN